MFTLTALEEPAATSPPSTAVAIERAFDQIAEAKNKSKSKKLFDKT
jgi:hypothetical protein